MITGSNLENVSILRDGTDRHLHGADQASTEVKRIANRDKARARAVPNENPSVVLAATVGNLPEEVIQRMPERRIMKKTINRVQVSEQPRNSHTLRDLFITAPYDCTSRGQFPFRAG
ncbi:hypothetical protein ANN_11633 [Periplaneta americana]|uniref:Uncharacterized protein n=1 Tax=Periplaneta americana TaxID=6978 RepID=A0ABQ8T5L7_PERAM|nr:hypothetical protein ANN_11633 [Periplaneta americana]